MDPPSTVPPSVAPIHNTFRSRNDPEQDGQCRVEASHDSRPRDEAMDYRQAPSSPPQRPTVPAKEDRPRLIDENENENIPAVNMRHAQAQTQQASRMERTESSVALSKSDVSQSAVQRPFSTKSNKESMSKSLVLASKLNRDSRASAGRSSVFRKKLLSGDNDTVASTKSAATAASLATGSKKGTTNTATEHDKAALRQLLGTTAPLETKPTMTSVSSESKPKISIPAPTSAPAPAPTTESVSKPKAEPPMDETFDQKEYLRNLISSKNGRKSTSTTNKPASANNTIKTTEPSLSVPRGSSESAQVKKGASALAAKISSSPRSNLTGSSSASADQKAILRKVLAKTMNKKSSDERSRQKLSPKNDPSKLESAAVDLSRKVLSDQSKPLTPKKSHRGFKGYVRSKMGLSRKSPKQNSSNNYQFESNLANPSSVDSADSSMVASRSLSQAASKSMDSSDDDKTKTTQASSSNESGVTKTSYESSLKGLMTAETIDTDESSTIMGNLQCASSDSMQYSSEEGCEDSTEINRRAFHAIDSLAQRSAKLTHPKFPRSSKPEVPVANSLSSSNHHLSGSNSLAAEKEKQHLGYTKFLKALQSEASGSHSQLWSSFQSVMTGSPRRAPNHRGEVTQYRFDPATRQMLAAMNSHLKGQAMVECVTSAQLVNDKKFAKEIALGLTPQPVYATVEKVSKGTKHTSTITRISNQWSHSNLGAVEVETKGSTTNITDTTKHTMPAEAIEKAPSFASLARQRSKDSSEKSVQSAVSKTLADQPIVRPADRNVHNGAPLSDNTRKVPSSGASKGSTVAAQQNKVANIPVQSQPKKAAPVPWSGVRLRSVSNSETPTSASEQSIDQSSGIPSPWAKVKLKRIPLDENETPEMEQREQEEMQENDSLGDSGEDSACRSTEETNEEEHRSARNQEDSPAQEEASAPENRKAGISVYCKPSPERGSKINIKMNTVQRKTSNSKTNTSVDRSDETVSATSNEATSLDKAACTFVVRNPEDGSDSETTNVVIDKQHVTMTKIKDGAGVVIWSLPKGRFKSLKLDMESQRVNLSLLDGDESKALSFMNSTDCLKFANAFYEMQDQQSRVAEPSAVAESKGTNHQATILNHEEQKVLETYRQARRVKPAEDALRTVVQGPVAALQEASDEKDSRTAAVFSATPPSVHEGKADAGNTESHSFLSEEAQKVAQSYKKMLKLQIPPDAVRHKMVKEEVDPKVMAFVLAETGLLEVDSSCPEGFSEGEREITILYRNMLKLLASPDDVRSRMKADGVDEKIFHAVFGEEKTGKKSVDTKLTEAEEAIAAPYRKMLKMMIPKDAVRHKMAKDQVDAKIVTAVVGPDESQASGGNQSKLTPAEEMIAATYRKMLKLQMPPEAVQHRMKKEGVSEKIVKAVLGIDESKSSGAATAAKGKSGAARGNQLVSLHWTPLSGTELDNSVWAATKSRKGLASQPERSDISKLVELFQKKSTNKAAKGKAEGSSSDTGTGKAKLLDLNRANIIAISLKAFKDFSHDELAEILQNLDPLCKLKGERVQFVKDLLPTPAEVNTIKRYFGSPDRLVPAELWFQKVAHVKRLEAKAHVLHTMEVFESEVKEMQKSLHLLTQVCNQVMESERLRELLDMVLQIGNIMNEGTRTGGASGFKFDSLLRLTQTKSGDGKTTVLDYIVTIYVAKGQRQTLNLIEDFPECQAASRILISDLVTNIKDAHDKLQECQREYEALVAQSTGKASIFENNASKPADPHSQLLSAITSRGTEDKKGGFLDDIKAKNSGEATASTTATSAMKAKMDSSPKNTGLQAGIQRLSCFLSKANKIYSQLKSDRDTAIETCKEMSIYCGESGGERATDTLLNILSEFASNMQGAVTKHDKAMQAEAKKQKQNRQDKGTPKKQRRNPEETRVGSSPSKRKPSPAKEKKCSVGNPKGNPKQRQSPGAKSKPQGKGTSLVLMVNELLREANEQTKKDFSQGVVYEDPDSKLKAIYDREKQSKWLGAPPLPTGRRSVDGDLFTTIKKRQGEPNCVAAKAKRSQLERVIDYINCASDVEDIAESPSNSSCGTLSDCSDHSSSSPTNNNQSSNCSEGSMSKKGRHVKSSAPGKHGSLGALKSSVEKTTEKGKSEAEAPSVKAVQVTAKKTTSSNGTSSGPPRPPVNEVKAPDCVQQQDTCTIKPTEPTTEKSGTIPASPKVPIAPVRAPSPTDRFKDLESRWKEFKSTPRRMSASSQGSTCPDDSDEGSAHHPIDCSSINQ